MTMRLTDTMRNKLTETLGRAMRTPDGETLYQVDVLGATSTVKALQRRGLVVMEAREVLGGHGRAHWATTSWLTAEGVAVARRLAGVVADEEQPETPAYVEPVFYVEPVEAHRADPSCSVYVGANRRGVADVNGRVFSVGDRVRRVGEVEPPRQSRSVVVGGTEEGVVVGFREGYATDYQTFAHPVVQWQGVVRLTVEGGHYVTTKPFKGNRAPELLEIITDGAQEQEGQAAVRAAQEAAGAPVERGEQQEGQGAADGALEAQGDGWVVLARPVPGVAVQGAYRIPGEAVALHVERSGWGGEYRTYRVRVTEDVPRIGEPGAVEYRTGEVLTLGVQCFDAQEPAGAPVEGGGQQEGQEGATGAQEAATGPLADWERELLAMADSLPAAVGEPSAELNIAQGDAPQEGARGPVSVWVTAEDGKRVEYAYIPNGDPARVEHFMEAARRVPTFRDVSTEERTA